MSQKYTKSNPFFARIKERYNLCKVGSEKSTFHVVLDLNGSGITYKVGDSIAIHPTNDPKIVKTILSLLNATGEETVSDRHTKEPLLLKDCLTDKINLTEVSKKFITELAQRQSNQQKKKRLELLVAEGQKELLKEYQAAHEVWDVLEENQEVVFSPEELCHLLQPLLPRFYSIASSMSKVGNEVHLLVSHLSYETNGYQRCGICTDYLCYRAPLEESIVPVYLQPSHGFTIPEENNVSVIMVGPGTGVAPYRGFMQEREARQAEGRNWLFFGEQHCKKEFFYENEWKEWHAADRLKLDTAFSRDQEHKIYVQHKMIDRGKEIFEWLESGAYFYVCGDAHRMAKDVDAALHLIVQVHGNLDEAGSKEYVKKLRGSKRYLRDIY
jgi:sulfite reductase (NADPH) flavoprotein alpha-component